MEFNVQQDLIENIQEIENRLQLQSPNIPLEFQVDTVLTSIDNKPAKKKRGRPKTFIEKDGVVQPLKRAKGRPKKTINDNN
ncbi:hypothetical protein BpHYR1_006196 [Brachionus plicatilis]|uniref:Uncharacterized protein n=1 Tax=Brachionus plicatilis TaxID=10195 RepID=A0A3M7SN15_BRAPC|nr:hypothetical protein BpHYR1_006196 [Brachionus plicatilis]